MDKIIIPLLIISCLTNFTYSRPSKALDQQGTELEWEAWLLVQDTSRSSKADDLKRITPKSIFTVRPFSPDMLPACAEGYRSDAMGRCVKFIKIDQTSHLGFLVEKLNTMYVEEDYDDEVEEPQPLQFNIPFGETISETMDTSETSKPEFLPNLTENSTLNVITKEMLTNFTNTSILSIFDELLIDEPVVVNETEIDNNKTLPTRATNQIDTQKSETVIIFFQPLKNNTNNITSSIDEEDQLIIETVNAVNVTKEVIAEDVDKLLQNNTLLHQIDDYLQINNSVNGTIAVAEAEETIEPSDNEKDDEPERQVIPFKQIGDYKFSYFNSRWDKTTEKESQKNETEEEDKKPTVQILEKTTQKAIPKIEDNHRNRDRTLLRLNPNHKYFTPTTERVNNVDTSLK